MKKNDLKKRAYLAPKIEKIVIDKNISMVMMSSPNPPGDPGSYLPGKSIFK